MVVSVISNVSFFVSCSLAVCKNLIAPRSLALTSNERLLINRYHGAFYRGILMLLFRLLPFEFVDFVLLPMANPFAGVWFGAGCIVRTSSRMCCMSPMDPRVPWVTRVLPWGAVAPHGTPQSPMGRYSQPRYRVSHGIVRLVPRWPYRPMGDCSPRW